MEAEISNLTKELDSALAENLADKASSCVRKLTSALNISFFISENISFIKEIYRRILPLTIHRHKSLAKRSLFFCNHWNNLFSALDPLNFFVFCQDLDKENLSKYMEPMVNPLARTISKSLDKNDFSNLIVNILKSTNAQNASLIPSDAWQAFADFLTNDAIEELIRFYVSKDTNESGLSILVERSSVSYCEIIFSEAPMEFICRFFRYLPKNFVFDHLTVTSRIADALVLDGYNPEVAYVIIPYVIKEGLNEVENSAFHPFWIPAEKYLQAKNSVSALFALYSGIKANLCEEKCIIHFLKFDTDIDPKYRLASFQIGLDLFDNSTIQPKILELIHSIAMTRGTAMFCCLVDHLPKLFPKLLSNDEDMAYGIVNTIMNPIPFDQFLPIFVLKFLNSISDLNDPKFTFDPEEVVGKYMTLSSENLIPELRKLINKINIHVNMMKVDWFDYPVQLSLELVDDVDPNLLIEIMSLDTIHISLIPKIIDKLAKMKKHNFINCALLTLFSVVKSLGLNLDAELEKKEINLTINGHPWLSEDYVEGSVQYLEVPIAPNYLGSIIKSLISYICGFIKISRQPVNVQKALLIVADFLSSFMADQSLKIIYHLNIDKAQNIEEIIEKSLRRIEITDNIESVKYLYKFKNPEETLENYRNKVFRAISVDYKLAKIFAPLLNQPIKKMRTFLAFEGIEKHAEWIAECKKLFKDENQWIKPKGEKNPIEQAVALKEKEFRFVKVSPEKGIENLLDGNKYSLIQFFYFSKGEENKLANYPLNEIEKYVLDNSNDLRLVVGFFYYALNHNYHTQKVSEWVNRIKPSRDELTLYAISLFLSTLNAFKFTTIPMELKDFILLGLNSIGYYAFSKELLVYAFNKETSMRWFFIRSIIGLDPDHFNDNPLIIVEYTNHEKLNQVYKPFFESLTIQKNIEMLMSIFVSITKIYFIPKEIVQNRLFPLAHNCLYSVGCSSILPPPIKLDTEFIESLLSALSKQKFFPVAFFTFFAHVRLTHEQFKIVHDLLEPKTATASNFFRFLLPSVYFDVPDAKMTVDEKTAIHFSNRPPSYSRAFFRSLMMPFTPPLPQKLIVELKDLLCEVFPPFSYNALNTWMNLDDHDKIILQDYPDNVVEHFKNAGGETIEIYRVVMSDQNFSLKNEVTEQIIKTALSKDSCAAFAIDVCNVLVSFNINIDEYLQNPDILECENFLCLCVMIRFVEKELKLESFTAKVESLIKDSERQKLLRTLNQNDTIEKIIHQ